MNTAHTPHPYSNAPNQGHGSQPYDPSGQNCPPSGKARVTATLWEDEGTLCFQIESGGICVARREGRFPRSVLDSGFDISQLAFCSFTELTRIS